MVCSIDFCGICVSLSASRKSFLPIILVLAFLTIIMAVIMMVGRLSCFLRTWILSLVTAFVVLLLLEAAKVTFLTLDILILLPLMTHLLYHIRTHLWPLIWWQ